MKTFLFLLAEGMSGALVGAARASRVMLLGMVCVWAGSTACLDEEVGPEGPERTTSE